MSRESDSFFWLKLQFRLYDPDQGEILLDGQNLRDLKISSFRKSIGVISQFPYMFNDTVMNNLLYGNQSRTPEEAIELCKTVNLHDTIMVISAVSHSCVALAESVPLVWREERG